MEPADLFDLCIYRWFRTISKLVGIDLFAKNFKPNTLAYIFISSLLIFLLSGMWTIYAYEFDDKVICSAAQAFNCQGIIKFFSVLTHSKSAKDICDFSSKIYRANKTSSPNKTYLAESVKITVLIFKSGMALLIIAAILTCMRPFFSYFLVGDLVPILPAYFPGIDENKVSGYTIIAIFHTYIAFNFVIGTAGCNLFLMAVVIHSYTMAKMFHNSINEFNRMIEKHQKRKVKSQEIRMFLDNLILMHKDFIWFTRTMKTAYNEMCLIQITMANVAMIVLVYVILMVDWFPSYFLMAVAFFQVFEYSLMGTAVEISNDKIYDAICRILITDLPIKEQKKVIFMTLLAQHPHNLTIGGFQSLNVETFIVSMKNTYTVGMLLVNTRLQ